MAVDSRWRLYYNDAWVAAHTVEENAAVLIHEVSHLLREHEARKQAAAVKDDRRSGTPPTDCEINDDLAARGTAASRRPAAARSVRSAHRRERRDLLPPAVEAMPIGDAVRTVTVQAAISRTSTRDCGSGAHGERRPWELPDDDGSAGGVPGVDPVKAELVRRDVAQRILDRSGDAGDVPLGWRRWAHTVLTPKVDYMATIRHAVRKALRDSTLGRYDRTYSRPHRRQAPTASSSCRRFYQPRPRPGF